MKNSVNSLFHHKMSFEKFNQVCLSANLLPTKKIQELSTDLGYMVTGMRKVRTKYGARVIVSIENTFEVFLPVRASKMLDENEELLEELVNLCSQEKLKLYYRGGEYNLIEWEKL